MSLEHISKQLSELEGNLPPVELWNPPYCGEMPMEIKADGSWFYMGTVISRERLVKLFSTVLKKELDEYFLVTPVEKIKITVTNEPFVITHWRWLDGVTPATIELVTNLGDMLLLDNEHQLEINEDGVLKVRVRRNLYASIHRNVFYQWAELAEIVEDKKNQHLVINSAGINHILGEI